MISRLKRIFPLFGKILIIFILWLSLPPVKPLQHEVKCADLRLGQYRCNIIIDPETQQPVGCTKENIAKMECECAPDLICQETGDNKFEKDTPCLWTNGYSFSTSLLLSVFFGFLGVDRFYLGHYGMGALKFCTFGFLLIGHLLDIILIATQNVLPSDGSNYVIPYYGPKLQIITPSNFTYIVNKIY